MATKIAPESLALALTSAGGVTYAPATITATDAAAKVDGASLVDATETDLSSSYAPPGSPVLDDTGALIGIVVGTANGRVVLCPSWLIRPVTDELEHLGRVTQGWMGINGTTVRATGTGGVRVLAVTPGSAASRAGIAVGDIITAVDAEPVPSITALQGRLYADRPGSTVAVVVLRKGAAVALRLTLGGAHG
jgi:S1-C subfamily serine protease